MEVKTEPEVDTLCSNGESVIGRRREAVAMDCEMVGGGSDGSLNVCARVCLVDEDENLLLHTYVQPQIPVTDYRYLLFVNKIVIFVGISETCFW